MHCERCGHLNGNRDLRQVLNDVVSIPVLAAVARLERLLRVEGISIVATVADLNSKLDELVKDVKRVLDIVTKDPNVGGATQAEVDALAQRLDSLDADVETASPENPNPEQPPTV